MDRADLLSLLKEVGLTNERDGRVVASSRLIETRKQFEDSSKNEIELPLSSLPQATELYQSLNDRFDSKSDFLITFLTLTKLLPEDKLELYLETESAEDIYRDIFVITRLYFWPSSGGGTPNEFCEIPGDQIQEVATMFSNTLVYVWRENCPPCDMIKDDLDEIFKETPDDKALFSVYGPGFQTVLEEEFHVVGAPTLLFFVNGAIDVRLQGPQPTSTLSSELKRSFGIIPSN